jgi:hypothetical protein
LAILTAATRPDPAATTMKAKRDKADQRDMAKRTEERK